MSEFVRVVGGRWWLIAGTVYVGAVGGSAAAGSFSGYYLLLPSAMLVFPWLLYGVILPVAIVLGAVPGTDSSTGEPALAAAGTAAVALAWLITAAVNFALFRLVVVFLGEMARRTGLCRRRRPALAR